MRVVRQNSVRCGVVPVTPSEVDIDAPGVKAANSNDLGQAKNDTPATSLPPSDRHAEP